MSRQLNGRAREERTDGIAFFVAADGNSSCVLGEEVACRTTPIGKDNAVTVVFDELRGKVPAEERKCVAPKLFQHDWLPSLGWGLQRLCHRSRLPQSYLRAVC